MEKIIRIKKIRQKLNEPLCGPITYCAMTGEGYNNVESYHQKGCIKPSIGFFYLSFHKIDLRIRSYVEKNGNMLNIKDTDCFETLWRYESHLQTISKDEFIEMLVSNNQNIFKKYKKDITIYSTISHKTYRKVIFNSLKNGFPVGGLIMINLNKYRNQQRNLFIPHWIIIHGFNEKSGRWDFLVYNSYEFASKWLKEIKLFEELDSPRNFHMSPQLVILNDN